jgi:hypothetical protein
MKNQGGKHRLFVLHKKRQGANVSKTSFCHFLLCVIARNEMTKNYQK